MLCLHPHCPTGHGLPNWNDVLNDPRLKVRPADRQSFLPALNQLGALNPTPVRLPVATFNNRALLDRLLGLCPCLYNQIDITCSSIGVVHLCELTLQAQIKSDNVYMAFRIQYPNKYEPFTYPPCSGCKNAGNIMEELCSEVLTNEGIPLMELDESGWPLWKMPGHIMLNKGKMQEVKAFGDILIPAAPTNIIISIKTEAARERLLYSANMIEGVGFGFFNEPSEFWSESRMNLFKRMGFSAIYLPDRTHVDLMTNIKTKKRKNFCVNINGKPLYRPLNQFGSDIKKVVGKTTLHL